MIRRALHAARRDQRRGKAHALHCEILDAAAPLPEQRLPDAFEAFLCALTRAWEQDQPATFVQTVDGLFARWPRLRGCPVAGEILEQRASAAALVAIRDAQRGTGATFPSLGGQA
ncbi:MAG: hypothetical protein IPJ34_22575 [Myxococcales bacterium]|nr:hypothetical protein [Myxococcales bacterium]